ncbi:tRNA uridine 5-carboxymethylaminomethyl modification enzyme MnmG [Elysia marginata]|uniref:tRNA uridine 5-carboxymethylaminomethyl modification enzyme MnmG n=1 Tax=Elysia marginata TaxID=1093978 RepID=A0AAV4EJ46_9GAST|nr:tRNA uridine 5-carboxymethylaminomethyl modification enzyme MnmG [Elysia marginata]
MYRQCGHACEQSGMQKATQDKSGRIFDTEFNLGFHRPKKDQCETRISYANNKDSLTEEDKLKYEKHVQNKNTARDIKNEVKADKSPHKTSCAFDLQQILLCPHGLSSSCSHKRRLGVYDLTIYDYKKGDAFCFMWSEHEGRRGSNERGKLFI